MTTPKPVETPPMSAPTQAAAAWIALYSKWEERFESWAEFWAKFWAAYWLLIIGSFLILGSAFLKWVQYPLTSNLSGLKFPLFHDSGVIPHVTLLSFGVLGIVVLIAGVILRRFFALALGLAAAVLITVSVLTPAHIAFQQPMMLRHLIDELQAVPWHKVFTKHYFNSGSIAKAQGHNQEAIADYRKAMKWDAWHAQDIGLYATIGDLQKKSGIENNSPERHISRAVELQQAKEYEAAIFELSRAAEASGAIAAAARRESAKTRIELGLALYQAGGIGGAVTNWQLALADDPTQEVFVLPYLAQGYFDLGRYEIALQTIDRLIKIIAGHSSMVADAYSLGGDCYAKLGRDADARRYYSRSYAKDWIVNYWAISRLAGE